MSDNRTLSDIVINRQARRLQTFFLVKSAVVACSVMVRTPQKPVAATVLPVLPLVPGWARSDAPVTDSGAAFQAGARHKPVSSILIAIGTQAASSAASSPYSRRYSAKLSNRSTFPECTSSVSHGAPSAKMTSPRDPTSRLRPATTCASCRLRPGDPRRNCKKVQKVESRNSFRRFLQFVQFLQVFQTSSG
jgi:hypothetical protein